MKNFLVFFGLFAIGAFGTWFGSKMEDHAYIKGYNDGVDTGFTWTINLVHNKLEEQLNSDTTISKWVIVNPDTTIWYLSRKDPFIDTLKKRL